ncbi:MAG: hypothetical protein ACREJO_05625 [Phycisphaerales bacterium]
MSLPRSRRRAALRARRARRQTGFWDVYAGVLLPGLFNTAGAPTGVSLNSTGAGFLAANNDPGTFGDDEALLDDAMGYPFADTYTFTGLAAGTYQVYCYTWTFSVLTADVSVNASPSQQIGGVWSGSFTPGMYSLHTVTIGASQPLIIQAGNVDGAIGAITGVQIVPVPTPGAAGLLAMVGIIAGRRRH